MKEDYSANTVPHPENAGTEFAVNVSLYHVTVLAWGNVTNLKRSSLKLGIPLLSFTGFPHFAPASTHLCI